MENSYDNCSLSTDLQENINMFKNSIFNKVETIKFKYFENPSIDLRFYLIFHNGMIDDKSVDDNILYPILNSNKSSSYNNDLLYSLHHEIISCNDSSITNKLDDIINGILYGDTFLIVDGYSSGILIDTKGWEGRAISEPQLETSINGPKEGFCESLLKNISMVRRKITNPNLKCEFKLIGTTTNTQIALLYIDNLVSIEVLTELKSRLEKAKVDELISIGKLTEQIEDNPKSLFRQIGVTERPDVICQKLTQGKVAILCDGTPSSLTIPFLFNEYFSANEDYFNNFILSSFYRILRYFCFFIGTSVPAIYLAALAYHEELIPTKLILVIFKSRAGVPLSTFLETFLLLFIFEILKEAALRLPKNIGAAVSIVGGLVLSDAIVSAKFVSSPVVIVVAVTELSSLILTYMQEPLILVRFLFLLSAGLLGIFGYISAGSLLIIHLIGLESFGVSYLKNFLSFNSNSLKDTFFRFSWQNLTNKNHKDNNRHE